MRRATHQAEAARDYHELEREAVRAFATSVVGDPSATAVVKRAARERLKTMGRADAPLNLSCLTPRAVRSLRRLIRGVLNGTLQIPVDDDDSPTLPASHE